MAQQITIHDHRFLVEASDWAGHDADCDRAVDHLITMLKGCSTEGIAELHRQLTAYARGEMQDYPLIAQDMCGASTRKVTRTWRGNNFRIGLVVPGLSLGAA